MAENFTSSREQRHHDPESLAVEAGGVAHGAPPTPRAEEDRAHPSTVQRAIEAQERIIQTTTELKKALMHKLFTEGLRHEPQKQTEIGPVPESWEVVPSTPGELCVKPIAEHANGPPVVNGRTNTERNRVADSTSWEICINQPTNHIEPGKSCGVAEQYRLRRRILFVEG